MGKGDTRHKRKRAGRKRKIEALRYPNGSVRRHENVGATAEVLHKRRVLLGVDNAGKCLEDPIDVCEAQEWLTPEQANAARKLKALHRRLQAAVDAPRAGGSPLKQFLPSGGDPEPLDEDSVRKLRNAFEDAIWAVKCAGSREARAVEKFISHEALPLPRELDGIRGGLEWLVDHFGLRVD